MQEYEYFCTRCGRATARDLLTVKKVLFVEMGKNARTIRSRVTDWLCPPCVKKDPVWNLESHRAPTQRKRETNGSAAFVPPRKQAI